jgi:glycosyltransferase involved in cell wall biosynthesis
MKILAVTNMYPTASFPAQGTFVERQIESLRPLVDIELLHIDRVESGRGEYSRVRARLQQAISGTRPDAVHVMYGGALALLAATAIRKLPFVLSVCGSDVLGDPQLSLKRRAFGRATVWATKIASFRADAIVAKSRQLAARLPAFVPAKKIHVIPNGVDLERFRPRDTKICRQRLGWSDNEFHVLFTGDPANETKRYADAREAVECLRARGVPARLQVMRGVSHDQVPSWLNAAHVMLLCSLHEGSPNIVKESLACECPVVSTDIGDVAERIEGIEGCYISARNIESFANCLHNVFLTGSRLNCRDKLSAISLAAIAERIVSIYHDVCQSRGSLSTSSGFLKRSA